MEKFEKIVNFPKKIMLSESFVLRTPYKKMESSMFYTYFTLKYHKKNMLNKMQTNYNEYRHVGLRSLTN